jgi:hypothetical protein
LKKIILVVAFFITSMINAQDINFYGGLSYSGIKGSDRIPGIQLGIEYHLKESMTIGGGLAHRGGEFDSNNDSVDALKLDGFALETWMSYSFMKTSNASLWIGPSYSYIFKLDGDSGDGALAVGDTGNDYGILIGGTIFLDNESIKIGYYNGMTDENYNKFFVNYGFSF